MAMRKLSVGVSRPPSALPPLSESGNVHIVISHPRIDSAQSPTAFSQAHRQIRFLSGDNRGVVKIYLAQRGYAKKSNSPDNRRLADRHVPIVVTQGVIDRARRKTLAKSAIDRGEIGFGTQSRQSRPDPRLLAFTITAAPFTHFQTGTFGEQSR